MISLKKNFQNKNLPIFSLNLFKGFQYPRSSHKTAYSATKTTEARMKRKIFCRYKISLLLVTPICSNPNPGYLVSENVNIDSNTRFASNTSKLFKLFNLVSKMITLAGMGTFIRGKVSKI